MSAAIVSGEFYESQVPVGKTLLAEFFRLIEVCLFIYLHLNV